MAINILYSQLQDELVAVLGVGQSEEEYRIEVFLKMAVRDILDEFKDNIGTRTVRDLNITLETDVDDGEQISRIYMPDDCWTVRQIMVEGIEIEPVDSSVFEKIKRSATSGTGYVGKIAQREDGRVYCEVWPTISTTTYDIAVSYKIASEDVGRIPQIYKNAVVYGVASHWYNFVHTENPVMKSQMNKLYKQYIGKLRSDVNNTRDQKINYRPFEYEWENQFLYFTDRNDRDRRN